MNPFLKALTIFIAVLFASCEEANNTALSFDNVPIAYTDDGNGSPTLLFVHGWCTDGKIWENQVEEFKKDHRTVTIDLAGHGSSGKFRKNWNPENFARDVTAVINELQLDDVVLIGHSISEETILRATRMEPRKIIGIIGVDNFKDVDLEFNDSIQQVAEEFFGFMDRNFKITAELYANEYLFSPYTDGTTRNYVIDQVKKSDPEIAKPILRLLYTDYQNEKTFLKQLITPLYLINSDFQPTDTIALDKYCNHGYNIRFMSKVGHFPMLEDPETFNEILRELSDEIKESNFNQY